jgi:carbamate kinase
MRVVVALGGNALQSPRDCADQTDEHVRAAVRGIAEVALEHDVVVTHGNGPQVGVLASQETTVGSPLPQGLDALGAETEGMLGYLLQLELLNHVASRPVATLLTLVEVDAADAAFATPSKPIGMVLDDAARANALERCWDLVPTSGGWRRVVPSPAPVRLLSPEPLLTLVDAGAIVVCGGGGGIPVARSRQGLVGVEAVVDKDATSALVAEEVHADLLVFATDTDAVYDGWRTPQEVPLRFESPASLRSRSFASGSMQPKVDAACRFVTRTGRRSVIGALTAIPELVIGSAGTIVTARCAHEPAGR